MRFIETRGNDGQKPKEVTFSQAILNPAASFGGLYVPKALPKLDLEEFMEDDYKQLALRLLKKFDIDIEEELLKEALDLYDNFDDPSDPVPVVEVEPNLFITELYHGPTRAFKDMALQPFGHILSALARKQNQNYLILAATSGDTGPATLETFKNKANIKVACLYPAGGTSDVQRLQMVTEDGENLKVIGIEGDFDDAQTALKNLLASPSFKEQLERKSIKLSAANSVNFGRIIFQIIYHIHAYLELVRRKRISLGQKINIIVPSGNFGNALGGYYAKRMGLPIKKILIASNENNVLTELIKEGRYDLRDKQLKKTTSPAMDILKSSNVERVLFDKFGAQRTKELMDSLDREGYYQLSEQELAALQEDFDADFSSDVEVAATINEYATQHHYLMDPHTATTIKLHRSYGQDTNVAYSTAEWTKFAPTVYKALTGKEVSSDQEALEAVAQMLHCSITPRISELFHKPIRHDLVISKERIEEEILSFL